MTNQLTKEELQLFNKIAVAIDNFDPVIKDQTNGFFKSKYENLNSILEATTPALKQQKLLVTQPIEGNKVLTIITDLESGARTVSFMDLPTGLSDPQKLTACVTYFRRCLYKGAFGLMSEDDDGNKAAGKENTAYSGNKGYTKPSTKVETQCSTKTLEVKGNVVDTTDTGFQPPKTRTLNSTTNGTGKPTGLKADDL